MTTIEAANKYIDLGWILAPMPLKSKGPKKKGWNDSSGWIDTKAKASIEFANPLNMGVILEPSKLCVLDVDSVKNTKIIFEEYGFDYDKILGNAPRIRGAKFDRDKAIFRYPEGQKLEFHKLIWGSPPKEGTVFELRCGLVQDVLPPSIHPDGHAYEWLKDPFSGIPELPQELLNLWIYFKTLEEQLKDLDPNAKPKPRLKSPKNEVGNENIIGQFNAAHDLGTILESFGYKRRGRRFLSPSSTTGMAGVTIFSDTFPPKCVSKHGDSLNDGHSHDAFDVFRILKHNKNIIEAIKDAANILGIKFEPRKTQSKPEGKIEIRSNTNSEMDEMFRDIEDQEQGKRVTIDFPWRTLSEKSRALRPGTVVLVAGPAKAGKSFFIMNLVLYLHLRGVSWKYLPLEDARKDWLWRSLAILEGDYSMIDDQARTAEKRKLAFVKQASRIESLAKNVFQNPRVGVKDDAGNTILPPLPYRKVLDWVKDNVRHNRVLVLDPFAQIDFSGKTLYDDQAAFIRGMLGVVADSDCTIVINMHTVKTTNDQPLSLAHVQGAVDLVRLSHSILLLDSHDFKDSTVVQDVGENKVVSHNRTLTIGAVRNGCGTRMKIAFTQGVSGPAFEEHGIIIQKK